MNLFDPEEVELKIGLEIHQQLATEHKLFCHCSKFSEDRFRFKFMRRLRPTQSELGQIDPAALFEFRQGRMMMYHAGEGSSCLVEADEEPPHDLNIEAVEIAVLIALALKSRVIDELHTMRKIVIDGSNTTGFQRTLVVALGGELKVGERKVDVQTVSLEEDAARILGESESYKEYGLDRLGVPLVEVALAPITASPQEVQEVALSLGRLMRSTKRVARGLGTIRQDVNISIKGGNVVEVKGIQKLDLLSKIVEYEALRQLGLLKIRDELFSRGLSADEVGFESEDVSDIFRNTGSRLLKKSLQGDGCIVACRLKGFRGLFIFEPYPDVRLGKELAELVRFYGVGGLMHSDELPGYGIVDEEVDQVKKVLNIAPSDGFLILAGSKECVDEALKALSERVREAFVGVPYETRSGTADGRTRFLRPRPGPARMYPETDIPPVPLDDTFLKKVSSMVPEPWEAQIHDLQKRYGLSSKLAVQIFDSDYLGIFEELAGSTKVAKGFLAATFTETLVNLARQGLQVERVDESILREIFHLVDGEKISKEAVPIILEKIAKGEASTLDQALKMLDFYALSDEELIRIIDQIISEGEEIIREKGEYALGPLMGKVMAQVRGRADGSKVSKLLRERILVKSSE